MIRVKVSVSVGLVGCKISDELEFEDGTDDEEIEAACKEWAFERIEWNFWKEGEE